MVGRGALNPEIGVRIIAREPIVTAVFGRRARRDVAPEARFDSSRHPNPWKDGQLDLELPRCPQGGSGVRET